VIHVIVYIKLPSPSS